MLSSNSKKSNYSSSFPFTSLVRLQTTLVVTVRDHQSKPLHKEARGGNKKTQKNSEQCPHKRALRLVRSDPARTGRSNGPATTVCVGTIFQVFFNRTSKTAIFHPIGSTTPVRRRSLLWKKSKNFFFVGKEVKIGLSEGFAEFLGNDRETRFYGWYKCT